METVGIFGGTFDPVHFGHLRTALEIKQQARLGCVRFVPCARPPHRRSPQANPRQRLEMLQCAMEGCDCFSVDPREILRPGSSYTLDTLTSFRGELGPVALCLIIGMDALESFHRWHRWPEILKLAHLIVAHRPGAHWPQDNPQADLLGERLLGESAQLAETPAGGILLQTVTQLDISATALRRSIAAGQCIRYLTPEPVRRYIETNDLYRSPDAV